MNTREISFNTPKNKLPVYQQLALDIHAPSGGQQLRVLRLRASV